MSEISPSPAPKEPKPTSRAVRWLTYLVLTPLILGSTTTFGIISLICSIWDRSGRQQHLIARIWAKTLLRISLSPARVLGSENLPRVGAAVYASNHLSYMDTPTLFAKLPFQFRILAKRSLWKIPFIGWHLRRSGQLPVDQSSNRLAIASLSRGIESLRSGMPLVIFPEGGRSPDGRPQDFLPGCAFMAIKAQVPLIPLTLIGTYELLPMHTYHLNPRPLLIVIGKPILTEGRSANAAEALTAEVRNVISTTYMSYSQNDSPSLASERTKELAR